MTNDMKSSLIFLVIPMGLVAVAWLVLRMLNGSDNLSVIIFGALVVLAYQLGKREGASEVLSRVKHYTKTIVSGRYEGDRDGLDKFFTKGKDYKIPIRIDEYGRVWVSVNDEWLNAWASIKEFLACWVIKK